MRRKLIRDAHFHLRQKGFYFKKTTNHNLVSNFFKKIKPIKSQHELIRIGGNNDGGYLVPNDLVGIEACFSPGVSKIATFEEDLATRGVRSYLADYSVDSPPVINSFFEFEKKYVGSENTDVYTTIESWVSRKGLSKSRDLILQMDIEGGEYDVLLTASSDLFDKFRIVVIEFHNLDGLLDQYGYQLIWYAFHRILMTHSIVHIHPNNADKPIKSGNFLIPPTVEFTFLRNDRIHRVDENKCFPHPLDQPNKKNKPDIVLPNCWF